MVNPDITAAIMSVPVSLPTVLADVSLPTELENLVDILGKFLCSY